MIGIHEEESHNGWYTKKLINFEILVLTEQRYYARSQRQIHTGIPM